MAVLSKVKFSDAVKSTTIVGASVSLVYFLSKYKLARDLRRQRAVDEVTCAYNQKDAKKDRISVDAVFFRKLKEILKVCVPGICTPECFYFLLVAATLVGRTRCDLWMIHNGTVIERAIITRDKDLFWKRLQAFMFRMPLLSFVNNLLKFGLNELKIRLRTRLSKNLYNHYMSGMTYYQMSNLDARIANPDQLLTQDVEKFCNSVIDLYSNVSKPLLDIIIYVQTLTTTIGAQAPSLMISYLLIAGFFLTGLRKPVGRMTVTEQKLEGELRYVNSRLITNSEEVAFYNGGSREQKTLLLAFKRLVDHARNALQFQFCMGYIDNIVAKYWATVVGYFLISQPFFSERPLGDPQGERLENYYRTGRMLVKLAEAIGRLVLGGRELTRLAGFTSRVHQLKGVLDDLKKGHYERPMVQDSGNGDNTVSKSVLVPGAGRINTQDNIIRFDRVPLVTPNGDVLVNEMNFEVRSGMNVLICGPNGCGKSSLFRILGELWPLFGGALTKPSKEKLFYIPQKPYMTLGTLRDQVIYPDSKEDMLRKGITDDDLQSYMKLVQLPYLLLREGGFDSVQDWMDILSGGEKQRVAMARLFYNKPQFAILDECTSAVSVDVEGSMYLYCKEVGITLFTVSHRKSLWKYHEFYLHMDGRGSYEFKCISPDTEEFGS